MRRPLHHASPQYISLACSVCLCVSLAIYFCLSSPLSLLLSLCHVSLAFSVDVCVSSSSSTGPPHPPRLLPSLSPSWSLRFPSVHLLILLAISLSLCLPCYLSFCHSSSNCQVCYLFRAVSIFLYWSLSLCPGCLEVTILVD